jgi:hypothetical protein
MKLVYARQHWKFRGRMGVRGRNEYGDTIPIHRQRSSVAKGMLSPYYSLILTKAGALG